MSHGQLCPGHLKFKPDTVAAQFIAQGHLRVVDVSRAFGVPALSVKRALKRYRQEGPKGF